MITRLLVLCQAVINILLGRQRNAVINQQRDGTGIRHAQHHAQRLGTARSLLKRRLIGFRHVTHGHQ